MNVVKRGNTMKVDIAIPEKAPRYFKDVPKGCAFERPSGKVYIKTMSELQLNGSMINCICLSDGASHRFTPEDEVLDNTFKVVRDEGKGW